MRPGRFEQGGSQACMGKWWMDWLLVLASGDLAAYLENQGELWLEGSMGSRLRRYAVQCHRAAGAALWADGRLY